MDRIQSMLNRVPGYTGYRAKEDIRDEDRRLREASADALVQINERLTRRSADLARQGNLSAVSGLERLIGQIRLLADRIRTASYGYGGLFTDRSIDEGVLTQLRQFDHGMQTELAGLQSIVVSLADLGSGDQPQLEAAQDELSRLNALFDARTEVVDKAVATQDPHVLELLSRADEQQPSPLLSLSVGDALSILGDNFQVNAQILVESADQEIRLSRVSEEEAGATWLLGARVPSSCPSARLTEITEPSQDFAADPRKLMPGKATVSSGAETSPPTSASYQVTHGDDNRVSFMLQIGSDTRLYQGHVVRDIDVEIYGASESA